MRARPAGTLAAAAVALTACFGSAAADREQTPPAAIVQPERPAEEPPLGGTVRWAIQEPEAIVPPRANDKSALLVVDVLFDSLTDYDGGLRVVPAAAGRWESTERSTRWSFTLRGDGRFHNGRRVTAEDFRFAWSLAAATEGVGFHLRDVVGYEDVREGRERLLSGVRAVDQLTLQVDLQRPRADFAAVVAHPALGPVERLAWRHDAQRYLRRPIGNGPYRMVDNWAPSQFIRVSRIRGATAPRGGGPPGDVDEILFRITNPDTAYVAFQQGRVDITEIPSGALEQALDQYGTVTRYEGGAGVERDPTSQVYFIGFNVDQPPFDDPDVRRAVSLAIDRQGLLDDVLEGNGRGARSLIPPALPGYAGITCRACVHVPEEAGALFAEAGITELVLWFSRGGGHDIVARHLRENLAEAGVQLRFERRSYPRYLRALAGGEAGMYRFGWQVEYPVLDDLLYPLFHSSQIPHGGGGGFNYGRYADEGVDRLLERASRVPDRERRNALLQRAERIVVDRDQAVVPLLTYRHRLVVSDRVQGFEVDPFGRANIEELRLRGE